MSNPSPQPHHRPEPQQGDEGALFAEHADRLRAVVAGVVNTSAAVIEDACAFAWAQLLHHQPRRKTVFSWLVTVARREALRLDRIERRGVTLDTGAGHRPDEAQVEPAVPSNVDQAHDVIEALDYVSELLPERKRRIYTLFALGYTYAEIAALTGDTRLTVDRQLRRANELLRNAKAREEEG